MAALTRSSPRPFKFTKFGIPNSTNFPTFTSALEYLFLQDESIISKVAERVNFLYNSPTYKIISEFPGVWGSVIQFETEQLLAKTGAYESPVKHPFYSVAPTDKHPQGLHHAAASINKNDDIWIMYFNLLPSITTKGDDGKYDDTAMRDLDCLQAISSRIHYGGVVLAEAIYREYPIHCRTAIIAQNRDFLMELMTFESDDEMVKRVEEKAKELGQDRDTGRYKVDPSIVSSLFEKVIHLTKIVGVEYLLRRLD